MSMVIGYQWGDNFGYIGAYEFQGNPDDVNFTLPPRTTLVAPPSDIPSGKEAMFNELSGEWIIRNCAIDWIGSESIMNMFMIGFLTSDQIIEGFDNSSGGRIVSQFEFPKGESLNVATPVTKIEVTV